MTEYNVLGHGVMKPKWHKITKGLYNLLKYYKFDDKFHHVKQLGAIRYYLKGAHYILQKKMKN